LSERNVRDRQTDNDFSSPAASSILACEKWIWRYCIRRMGRWSFWSLFAVYWFIFDEPTHEKWFLQLCSQWPWPLSLRP